MRPALASLDGGSRPSHDMIVVGAGHNGLVAANYLANEGLDVLVVEASDDIGGMTMTAPMIAEAPHHLINHCAVDPILWSAGPPARDLVLEDYGLNWVKVEHGTMLSAGPGQVRCNLFLLGGL